MGKRSLTFTTAQSYSPPERGKALSRDAKEGWGLTGKLTQDLPSECIPRPSAEEICSWKEQIHLLLRLLGL